MSGALRGQGGPTPAPQRGMLNPERSAARHGVGVPARMLGLYWRGVPHPADSHIARAGALSRGPLAPGAAASMRNASANRESGVLEREGCGEAARASTRQQHGTEGEASKQTGANSNAQYRSTRHPAADGRRGRRGAHQQPGTARQQPAPPPAAITNEVLTLLSSAQRRGCLEGTATCMTAAVCQQQEKQERLQTARRAGHRPGPLPGPSPRPYERRKCYGDMWRQETGGGATGQAVFSLVPCYWSGGELSPFEGLRSV